MIVRSSRRRLSDKYIPVRRGVISRNKGDVKRCREENVKATWSFMATKWRCEGSMMLDGVGSEKGIKEP